LSLPNDKGYYLVYPEQKQNSSLISTFERWLISAAEDYVRDDLAGVGYSAEIDDGHPPA
jgi:hypothetical protein